MQQPHVAEAALVKEPVTALTQRLGQLLLDWPENPLLEQLIALCSRLLGASCGFIVLNIKNRGV